MKTHQTKAGRSGQPVRAARLRRTSHRHAATSPALRAAFAEMDARLAAARNPLADFTREEFEANRRAGIGDTLGVGPRLAPR
jgi:hypothetical protein